MIAHVVLPCRCSLGCMHLHTPPCLHAFICRLPTHAAERGRAGSRVHAAVPALSATKHKSENTKLRVVHCIKSVRCGASAHG